jgi:hypothetical protein
MSIMSQFQASEEPPVLNKRDTRGGCERCISMEQLVSTLSQENLNLRAHLDHYLQLIQKFD